jgi:Acyclic terpene utilisation family protein AtuA
MAISTPKDELRILTPIGMVGYGFSKELFCAAIEEGVDAIIVDAGSTDSGPSKLALGNTTVTREGYERDLGILVAACHSHRVPILIGSAGGDGADAHVDLFVEIVTEIITKNSYRTLNVISIYSEIPKDLVRKKLGDKAIIPCSRAVPELLPHDIDTASRIVAQMGLEPYLKAMTEHPDFDIIIGGRAYDPAPYAAFCLYHGFTDLGIAYHMGKLMECGALCATPKAKEALAIVRQDSFDIVPLDPKSRCTVISVAAHALYEKTRPDILHGPGGALLLSEATYEQLSDNRTVRVRGATFEAEEKGKYTVKLEGARPSGYHSIFIGGIRDPILITQLDDYISQVTAAVKEQILFSYDLRFITYGLNGVMGTLEQNVSLEQMPREVGICGHARAKTQAEADHVVNLARIYCTHAPYPHQLATAGNFAMPFAPCEVSMGQVSEFCIYHIMQIMDPVELFPIKMNVLKGVALKSSGESTGL